MFFSLLIVIPPLLFACSSCVVVLVTNDFLTVFILPSLTWFGWACSGFPVGD